MDNALLYKEMRDQDRRKNEFLAMLSHELRNPLAPITNAVHMLGTGDAAKVEWARDVLDRQVKQLCRLVDDLLDVSRITHGKIELRFEAVDVAAVIDVAVETVRPFIDARSHVLTVTPPAQPVRVRGDFARLAQVLANLLNNAAKYTADGGRNLAQRRPRGNGDRLPRSRFGHGDSQGSARVHFRAVPSARAGDRPSPGRSRASG
jgi:signal transduction histidine kinase